MLVKSVNNKSDSSVIRSSYVQVNSIKPAILVRVVSVFPVILLYNLFKTTHQVVSVLDDHCHRKATQGM